MWALDFILALGRERASLRLRAQVRQEKKGKRMSQDSVPVS